MSDSLKRNGKKKVSYAESSESSSSDEDIPLSMVAKGIKKVAYAESSESSSSDDDIPLRMVAKENKNKRKQEETKNKKNNKKRKITEDTSKKSNGSSSSSSSSSSSGRKENSSTSTTKQLAKRKKPTTTTVIKAMKKLTVIEAIDKAMSAWKWWDHRDHPKGIHWNTLEHCGVNFPPAYIPHMVRMRYDGVNVDLTVEQEEVATYYASVAVDGPQLSNPNTRDIFNKNFFVDFKKVLGKDHVIKVFSKCDFDPIREDIARKREIKKNRPKEEKDVDKAEKQLLLQQYGYLMVDDHLEKVGNITLEPSSLFRGRGEHPKMGCLKQTILPEMIELNTGVDSVVPLCPVPGHAFGSVVHRNDVQWLATWTENIMGGIKYVMLNASSSFKGKSDREKYEKARRLDKVIGKIRKDYTNGLKSKDEDKRQLATAMWVIDVLALRVGNEKGEEEADTVGCCSLRVEHMKFSDPFKLTLDFLGKDSMRYFQTIDMAKYDDTGKQVYNNLIRFTTSNKKKPADDVFNTLTPSALNKHLQSLMPGLSAKVFRTYNASITMEKQLPFEINKDSLPADQKRIYDTANRDVAVLCNHQKTVSKGYEVAFEKMEEKMKLLKKQYNELKYAYKFIKDGKEHQVKLKTATSDDEPELRRQQSHLFARTPSKEQIVKRVKDWKLKIAKHDSAMKNKDENKEVALGTSKINYIDPRVTVSWCKRNEVPIEKAFTKEMKGKFRWAMSCPPTWKF